MLAQLTTVSNAGHGANEAHKEAGIALHSTCTMSQGSTGALPDATTARVVCAHSSLPVPTYQSHDVSLLGTELL